MVFCTGCKQDKPKSEFHKSSSRSTGIQWQCKKCKNKATSEAHKIQYHLNPEKWRAKARELWKKNKIKYRANNRVRAWKRKVDILTHYSNGTPKCNCCGETEIKFLSLDHINGLSPEEKKKGRIRSAGHTFYSKLKLKGYPKGFQVLCYNCNCAKGFYGQCPHKR
jgi:tRNA(Ile2) C34 agmatinyltransferase TiaS